MQEPKWPMANCACMTAPNCIICDETRREEKRTHATMKVRPVIGHFDPWKNTLCGAFFYYMFPIIYPPVGGLSFIYSGVCLDCRGGCDHHPCGGDFEVLLGVSFSICNVGFTVSKKAYIDHSYHEVTYAPVRRISISITASGTKP